MRRHDSLLRTLDESARAGCKPCNTRSRAIKQAIAEYNRLVHKAASDTDGRDWSAALAKSKSYEADQVRFAEDHLNEPHVAPAPIVEKPRAAKAEKKDDGKVPCPGCGRRLKPGEGGKFAAHKSPRGITCSRRWLVVPKFDLSDVEINVGNARHEPVLKVDGLCHGDGCDRQLVGDRLYCGPCMAKREARVR